MPSTRVLAAALALLMTLADAVGDDFHSVRDSVVTLQGLNSPPSDKGSCTDHPLSTPSPVPLTSFQLSELDEAKALGPDNAPKLLALADRPEDFHPEREPLILVHGISGHASDLKAVVARMRDSRYQIYVLAYDSMGKHTSKNGEGLAMELRWLRDHVIGKQRDITIVAHSMGGLVSKHALNLLADDASDGLGKFGKMRLLAIDTPWHGAYGPADKGAGKVVFTVAKVFIPKGLHDMRAESLFFTGDRKARRAGVTARALPPSVEVLPVFAEEEGVAIDYTEGVLKELPAKLLAYFQEGKPVEGDQQLLNFWDALKNSTPYLDFALEVRAEKTSAPLTVEKITTALGKHFPRFPGDHVTVLDERPKGAGGVLDYLENKLK